MGSAAAAVFTAEDQRCSPRSTEEWRFWVDEARPGWTNMAIDQALLDRAAQTGECYLRLYRWEPHCLSFGRHEPATGHYDPARLHALGIDTVRRPTGGRAVWHSHELTYSLAAPCQTFGSLRDAYTEIHGVLASALSLLGVAVSLAPRRDSVPLEAGPCFAQAAGGEVMAGSRKVVGSAQLRRADAFLQHGSILLRDQQEAVVALSRKGSGTIPHDCSPVFDIPLSPSDLIEAIHDCGRRLWPGEWHRISNPEEILQAAGRHYPQFRSPAWTWRR